MADTDKVEITFREGVDDVPDDSLDHIEEDGRGGVRVDPDKLAEKDDQGSDEDRPEWLDEKFKSPEDLAKAYRELQRKLSSKDEGGADPDEVDDEGDDSLSLNDPKPKKKAEADTADAEQEAVDRGVDLRALGEEYMENGELSAETYAALEAKGYSREFTDGYISGKKAEAAQLRSRVEDVVGGEDALPNVLKWARAELSDGAKQAFERARLSGDADAAELAMRGIFAQYVAANGEEPNLVRGENARTRGTVEPFGTMEEYVEAIEDPRYDRSEKYRRAVDKRLAASDIW